MTSRYDNVAKLGLVILALVGVAMAGLALVTDRLGLSRQPGFGSGQACILVIGAGFVLTSLWLLGFGRTRVGRDLASLWKDDQPRIGKVPVDVFIGFLLFVLASLAGWSYLSYAYDTFPRKVPHFYQKWHAPAVALACGKGYVNLPIEELPELYDFLWSPWPANSPEKAYQQDFRFSCDDLPEDIQAVAMDSSYPSFHRYQMMTVGLFWRLTGEITWRGLAPLLAMFYSACVAVSYAVFRLGMGCLFSLAGVFLFAFSNLQLAHIPGFRDYSKAPFILALLFIVGYMVRLRNPGRRSLIILSAGAGIIFGVGLGFRSDLLAVVLPFAVTLLFFTAGFKKCDFAGKLMALGMFLIVFVVAGYPVLMTILNAGDISAHVTIMGQAREFHEALEVDSPLYEWIPFYSDTYVETSANSYNYNTNDVASYIRANRTPQYGSMARAYLLHLAKVFPADFITLAYASILKIGALPFTDTSNDNPPLPPPWKHLLALRHELFRTSWPSTVGLCVAVFSLLIVSAQSLRRGLWLLGLGLYFGGMPAMQFNSRHYFYLSIIGLWLLGFLCQSVIEWIGHLSKRENRHSLISFFNAPRTWLADPAVRRVAGMMFILGALVILLPVSRQYQHAQLGRLLGRYLDAARDKLPVEYRFQDDNQVFVTSPDLEPSVWTASKPGQPERFHEYLVLQFDMQEYNSEQEPQFTVRYERVQPEVNRAQYGDFTETFDLPLSDNVTMFIPVYYQHNIAYFGGLEIPGELLDSFQGMYRIEDLKQFPLLFTLQLPEEWESMPRYMQFTAPIS